ncbi:MAG: hypothetical protein J1E37_06000 [Prevotella sp.]|nr:hypothetical protein [Prevotella sp.]
MSNSNLLRENGFQGFKTIKELWNNNSQIPKKQGVYVVIYGKGDRPAFLEKGTGGFFKGKDPNVTIEELEQKWVENTSVLYIGKAGGTGAKATLNSRLVQYLKFGQGRNIGHWGGRYIWQLADAEDLIVCWKETTEEPRDVESKMIDDFKKAHEGKRPFANKAD